MGDEEADYFDQMLDEVVFAPKVSHATSLPRHDASLTHVARRH